MKRSFISYINCPPFPIAPSKFCISREEKELELAFSAISKQHATNISSEENWAVSEIVMANSMRHSIIPAIDEEFKWFATAAVKSNGVDILFSEPSS